MVNCLITIFIIKFCITWPHGYICFVYIHTCKHYILYICLFISNKGLPSLLVKSWFSSKPIRSMNKSMCIFNLINTNSQRFITKNLHYNT